MSSFYLVLVTFKKGMFANVRRYVHVGAESRWRVFLHSWCDAGMWCCFVYCRVGKNRDTRRGPPAGAGAGRTADHLTVFFSQKILAVRSANCIYRPVGARCFVSFILAWLCHCYNSTELYGKYNSDLFHNEILEKTVYKWYSCHKIIPWFIKDRCIIMVCEIFCEWNGMIDLKSEFSGFVSVLAP